MVLMLKGQERKSKVSSPWPPSHPVHTPKATAVYSVCVSF